MAMMVTYTNRQTAQFGTTPSQFLKLLRDEPLKYIDIIGLQVDQQISMTPEAAEWLVVEKLTIPFVPDTRFKTRFERLDRGSRWQSFAQLGVHVDSNLTIDDNIAKDNSKEVDKVSTTSATEVAILTCPFYVYPLVRWQFVKNHRANIVKLQSYVKSQQQ